MKQEFSKAREAVERAKKAEEKRAKAAAAKQIADVGKKAKVISALKPATETAPQPSDAEPKKPEKEKVVDEPSST